MYEILGTIEFLGGHISKNEIVSMKLQSLLQQNDPEENDLGHGGNCQKTIRK